jgi:hypothetical protein
MASKKFTDLPVATAADGADILAIVDVSTDTSKQITKDNFYKNLIPQGEYEPVVTLGDGAVSVTVVVARYTDYGDTVDVRLKVEYEGGAGDNGITFDIPAPVGTPTGQVVATFNGGGGDTLAVNARVVSGQLQITAAVTPDTPSQFDCVLNYKKA